MAKTKDKRIGNQFWKQRSKHGRDKIFSSPDILWEEACKYFEWVDEHPLIGADVVKSGLDAGRILSIPFMRAYTLKGLCLFLDVNEVYFNQFNDEKNDFSKVITRIRDIIYTQKFTGAAANLLNPNIIARDLGLSDKSESTTTHELGKTLTPDKIKEIEKAIKENY